VDDTPLKLKDAAGGAGAYLFQFNVDSVAGMLPHVIMAKQINALFSKPGPGDVVLLVSTRGCDLLQVDLSVPSAPKLYLGDKTSKGAPAPKGVLQRAHCNDELWGLACHPLLPQYVTVGDDKTLRFFCLKTKRMVRAVPLGVMSRCVAFNNTGALIALGTGGRVGKGKEPGGGLVRLYPAEHKSIEREVVPLHRLEATPTLLPLEKLAEAKDAKEWISDIKFSADGRTLVAGAHDCKIYIYKVEVEMSGSSVKAAKLSLSKTFAKHNSVINHLDLSADGRFMQSTCSAYELLFCDTSTGKQITSASELKDVRWDTWTSTLGWPVQGIWAPGMDGGDINAVARSHSGHLLTSSDDFGKVRLLRYPCLAENSAALSYSGHSSHVTCVRWTAADECVISTGGNDKTIMQWRHTMSAGGASKVEEFDDLDPAFSVAPVAPHAAAAAAGGADDHHHDSDELIASGGDESGCVKPWLGAVRAPKNPPPVTSNAPAVCLDLKWVHGYTSAAAGAGNTRVSNNLFYNPDGAAVFPAAALGVVMSRATDSGALTQRYFRGHNDDILCLAASPCRRFVATGQTASHTSRQRLSKRRNTSAYSALFASKLTMSSPADFARAVRSRRIHAVYDERSVQ
jgi:microtubule-associated protein-like 6